jgi:hypothetical protein
MRQRAIRDRGAMQLFPKLFEELVCQQRMRVEENVYEYLSRNRVLLFRHQAHQAVAAGQTAADVGVPLPASHPGSRQHARNSVRGVFSCALSFTFCLLSSPPLPFSLLSLGLFRPLTV